MDQQSPQTIKNLLKKFTNSNLLLVDEASEKMKMSKDYLMDLIKIGKVKAFKVGQDWFIEEDWLDDFKKIIKKGIEKELTDSGFKQTKQKFFKQVSYKKIKKKVFNFLDLINGFFDFLLFSLNFSLVLVSFSVLLFSLIYFDSNKLIIADKFTNQVDKIYSMPLKLVIMTDDLMLNNNLIKINDENLTENISNLFKEFRNNLDRNGQVAGESEGFER